MLQKIPYWLEVPLSGILVGLAPDGFTRLNKNDSVQLVQLLATEIRNKYVTFSSVFWST